jgi:hypothetical protein
MTTAAAISAVQRASLFIIEALHAFASPILRVGNAMTLEPKS